VFPSADYVGMLLENFDRFLQEGKIIELKQNAPCGVLTYYRVCNAAF
jgi:hypothetical protein